MAAEASEGVSGASIDGWRFIDCFDYDGAGMAISTLSERDHMRPWHGIHLSVIPDESRVLGCFHRTDQPPGAGGMGVMRSDTLPGAGVRDLPGGGSRDMWWYTVDVCGGKGSVQCFSKESVQGLFEAVAVACEAVKAQAKGSQWNIADMGKAIRRSAEAWGAANNLDQRDVLELDSGADLLSGIAEDMNGLVLDSDPLMDVSFDLERPDAGPMRLDDNWLVDRRTFDVQLYDSTLVRAVEPEIPQQDLNAAL